MTASSGSAARRARASSPWPARNTRNSAARIASRESSTRDSSSTIRIVVSSTSPPREATPGSDRATRRSSGRCGSRSKGPDEGQPQGEHRTAGRKVLRPDLPAVLGDDLVADGQAEPGALSHGLGGEEWIEDARQRGGGDTGAAVGDLDYGHRAILSRFDGDGAGSRDGLGGVGEHVQEYLVDLGANAFHRRQRSVLPDHRDPVFEQVIEQGQARVELLVQ